MEKPLANLKDKSIHDLRGIAQGYGIEDVFQLDREHLLQEIELKQVEMIPEPEIVIPRPEYDARLMTKPPSRKSSRNELEELLNPYILKGLHLDWIDEETWHMRWAKKEDTGTIRQPLRNVLAAAERIMR